MNQTATEQLIRNLTANDFIERFADRWECEELFIKRPLIAGDLDPAAFSQAAQRLLNAANANFMASGTNMTSALSTFAQDGGVTITTAGANNDQALLTPATVNGGATFITGLGGTSGGAGTSPFLSQKSPYFRCNLKTGASIAAVRIVAGLKLTSTPTVATDADQAIFSFDTASGVSATALRTVNNVGGASVDVATGPTLAANTNYLLEIIVDSQRIPRYYVNNTLITTGAALTTGIALIPVIGVQALAGAAKAITVRSLRLSRTLA